MTKEKGSTKNQFSTATESSLETVLATYGTLIKEGKLEYLPEEEAEARFDEILQRRRLREAQPVR